MNDNDQPQHKTPPQLSLSLTFIDRATLLKHVSGLESVKHALFVRMEDNLNDEETRDRLIARKRACRKDYYGHGKQ